MALALACCLVPDTSRAVELLLGVDGQYTYNSNFFSSSTNENEANLFQIGPSIELNDPDGRFRYELEYTGAYQAYADQDGVDAWESRLRARGTYDLTSRTSIRVTERFRDISNLRFSRQDIALADTALDPNQDRYFRNDVELELVHELTQLLELRLRGEHHWIDFDDNIDRNDSQAFEAGGELRYQVATRHVLGAGASYTIQDFDEALSRLGSKAEYVNSFATWTWNVTDEITFTANGGPSWIRSDEDDTNRVTQTQLVGGSRSGNLLVANIGSCNNNLASNCDFTTAGSPPIAASGLGAFQSFVLATGERVGTDSELTFFGGLSITASFAAWNLQASYSRRQSTTSGDGLASSLDRIATEIEYAAPRLPWSVFIAGSWDRRETLTDATVVDFNVVASAVPPVNGAQRVSAFTTVESSSTRRDNVTLITGYRHRFDRNIAGTLDWRYRRTELRDSRGSRPGIDTFFVVLTLEYDFDPISL